MENSRVGNSKLFFKRCVSPAPCLCHTGRMAQVSATRGWEVNHVLCSISISQLKKKKISSLLGKPKPSRSQRVVRASLGWPHGHQVRRGEAPFLSCWWPWTLAGSGRRQCPRGPIPHSGARGGVWLPHAGSLHRDLGLLPVIAELCPCPAHVFWGPLAWCISSVGLLPGPSNLCWSPWCIR